MDGVVDLASRAELSYETEELKQMAATFLREYGAFEFGLDLILDGLERLRATT